MMFAQLYRCLLAVVVILAASGCSRKDVALPVVSSETETQIAEKIAKPYVYQIMSGDKHGGNLAAKAAYATNTISVIAPEDFLVGLQPDRPYSRYKRKYRIYNRGEDRFVMISFFDPAIFPDWEKSEGMLGGFPAYFTVTVDLRRRKVSDSYASSM